MTSRSRIAVLFALAALLLPGCQHGGAAEDFVPPPMEAPREFRAMWIATVANIDWPKSSASSPEVQKAELLALLDLAKETGLNAVIFQVRPAADALYDSELEPWSEYLTGAMGRAPEPYYDPLIFAIEAAHARGLELHAWVNPYRARHSGAKSEPSKDHVSATRKDLVKSYGAQLWLDPGSEATREHSRAVIRDLVQRYDLDGIHYDDYFYPYPIRDDAGTLVPFPDEESYAAYQASGGTLERSAFRREAVDLFVAEVYADVKAQKPWVKVGISPFGIWRPGHPPQIKGFDAYEQLHADARKWLQDGHCDYFAPQLYWGIANPAQSFVALLPWWQKENPLGRHIWPGFGTYRIAEEGARKIPAVEIGWMVEWTRIFGAFGQIHFSAKSLANDLGGIQAILRERYYDKPALIPACPWLSELKPKAPQISLSDDGRLICAPGGDEPLRGFCLYEQRGEALRFRFLPLAQGAAELRLEEDVLALWVTAVDRYGNEGSCATLRPALGQTSLAASDPTP